MKRKIALALFALEVGNLFSSTKLLHFDDCNPGKTHCPSDMPVTT